MGYVAPKQFSQKGKTPHFRKKAAFVKDLSKSYGVVRNLSQGMYGALHTREKEVNKTVELPVLVKPWQLHSDDFRDFPNRHKDLEMRKKLGDQTTDEIQLTQSKGRNGDVH